MNEDIANVMGNFISTELDYIEQSNNEIEELQKENQRLKEENQILKLENENIIKYADRDYKINLKIEQKENQHLKDRVNKAIEYIEKCNPDVDLHSMFLNESYISNYGACELLEILKGVKDDNRK